MSAHEMQQMDRRGFVQLAGGALAVWLVGRVAAVVDVPGLGNVDVSTQHATMRHGRADVAEVLDALYALAFCDSDYFKHQSPCDDGRWRLIIPDVSARHKGIVVLEQKADSFFKVVTAFKFGAKSRYGKNVMNDCHGGLAA